MPIDLLHHDGLPTTHAPIRGADRVVAHRTAPSWGEHGLPSTHGRLLLVGRHSAPDKPARVERRLLRCDNGLLDEARRADGARRDKIEWRGS
jgi:hypothetical protein